MCFGLAAVCILLSCILGFGWFRVSQIQQQESDYESRMDTYVLVLQNYGKSMENVVTVLENDVYIRKLINRNTFTWDNTAGIAAQEVTNLVSVNPMIHSVYVWLEDDYLIKSTNPSYPIDQNGDARMLDIFQMSTFHESAVIPYLDIYGTHHWGQTQRHPSQHGSRQDHDLNPAEDGGGTVPADRQGREYRL